MGQLWKAGIASALVLACSAQGAEPKTREVLTGNSLAEKWELPGADCVPHTRGVDVASSCGCFDRPQAGASRGRCVFHRRKLREVEGV